MSDVSIMVRCRAPPSGPGACGSHTRRATRGWHSNRCSEFGLNLPPSRTHCNKRTAQVCTIDATAHHDLVGG
eukprot:m.593226 g.593226  ORF g.593226 m.593226 type:complete len:72 (-) comp22392_c0_seq5:1210-1425(-)